MMNVDHTDPEADGPDRHPAGDGAARQVVDWFALTEDNLPPQVVVAPTPIEPASRIETPTPADAPALEVPSACSIGGLRP